MTAAANKYWFVLYTKPRHEFKTVKQLENINVEYYLPTITVIKQWSDRKKKVTEPLFRGYVFIFTDEKGRLNSLEQTSVISSISFQGRPAKIPPSEIENLKMMLSGSAKIYVSEMPEIGTRVKVTSGPFAGIEGVVFQKGKNDTMLGITIELLNRTVSVKLSSESVTKALK